MAPMKRTVQGGGAAAKRARADPAAKRCKEAFDGLKDDSGLSKSVISMFGSTLEPCLLVNKDQRHPFQAGIVDMAGDALTKTEAALAAKAEQAKAAHAEGYEGKARLESQLGEAKEQADQKLQAMESQKRVLAEAASAYQAAKKKVQQIAENKDLRAAEEEAISGKKAKLQAVESDLIKPLVEGVEDSEARGQLIERLRKALDGLHFDDSILVALPKVFDKGSSDRGSFDTMVITNLHEEVARRSAGLDEELRALQETAAKEAADAAPLAREVEQTRDRQLVEAGKFTDAQDAEREAQKAVTDCKHAVRDGQKALIRCASEQHRAEKHLEHFRATALAAFLELRDRVTEVEARPEDADMEQGAETGAAHLESAETAA